jgi:hypothetical protein
MKKNEPKRLKVFSLGGEGWDYLVLCYLQCLPPRCLQYHHNFILDVLPKVCPFHLFTWAKVKVLPFSPETSILRSIQRFSFFPLVIVKHKISHP